MRRRLLAAAAVVLAAGGLAAAAARRPGSVGHREGGAARRGERLPLSLAASTADDATCQVEPLTVSYANAWSGGTYRVSSVVIGGITPASCAGASLSVTLAAADGTAWSGGPVTIGASTATVPLAAAAPAAAVTSASVRIVGGQVPVPPECSGLRIQRYVFGTPGADTLSGTPQSTLTYGLGGDDALSGLSGPDCLVGGPGDDRLDGGPGADVLLGGDGADRLSGGPGNDVLYGGPGDDHLDGGPGNDVCYRGGGNDTVSGCEVVRP